MKLYNREEKTSEAQRQKAEHEKHVAERITIRAYYMQTKEQLVAAVLEKRGRPFDPLTQAALEGMEFRAEQEREVKIALMDLVDIVGDPKKVADRMGSLQIHHLNPTLGLYFYLQCDELKSLEHYSVYLALRPKDSLYVLDGKPGLCQLSISTERYGKELHAYTENLQNDSPAHWWYPYQVLWACLDLDR